MVRIRPRAVLVDISKVSGLDNCIRGRRNAPFQCLSENSVRIQILAAQGDLG